MSDPDDILQSLVERPRETINIELKSWINPKSPEGEQKIARAALALRNQNGGYLVIGFNDKTCKPDMFDVLVESLMLQSQLHDRDWPIPNLPPRSRQTEGQSIQRLSGRVGSYEP